MVYIPLICTTLASDIKKLEAKFINGYKIEANVFYVFLTYEKREEKIVIDDEREMGGNFRMRKMRSLKEFSRNFLNLSLL